MKTRVLIHEWVTGGGLAGAPLPPSWAAEGRAMRRAIASDFHALDCVEVVATREVRFPGGPEPWQNVTVSEGEEISVLAELAARSDFTLVIAPETGGVLADLLRRVEQAGGRSLGSTPGAAAQAGDKLTLADHLCRLGIPTPPAVPFEAGMPVPTGFSFPLVLKPRDGAGALRTYRLEGPDDLAGLGDPSAGMILQPFAAGEPLSATFLVGPSGSLRVIGVGLQRIAVRKGVLTYEGGRLPVPSSSAAGPPADAVRAVPGLRGVVGVDFVRDPATGAATVIEINPRPTTSYVGLVRRLPPGTIAAAWLAAFRGADAPDDLRGMIPDDPGPEVEFRPDGFVRVKERMGMGTRSTAWLALDVGGANIKADHGAGLSRSEGLALWKRPGDLPGVLARLVAGLPPADRVALTMTAELCDAFATKREGVLAVLDAVEAAAPGRALAVWGVDGRLHTPEAVRTRPAIAAAANWLALATVAAEVAGKARGVLIDVGSTTTDLIPLEDGRPVPRGRTDTERLQTGELVYAGVRRTMLGALAPALPFRGRATGLMAEVFSTTRDVFLTLGDLTEDPSDLDTADGRPATRDRARDRLARVVGADSEGFTDTDARQLSLAARECLLARFVEAAGRAGLDGAGRPHVAVVSGSGEFLAAELAGRLLTPGGRVVRLSEAWGPEASGAACARALRLIAERHPDPAGGL